MQNRLLPWGGETPKREPEKHLTGSNWLRGPRTPSRLHFLLKNVVGHAHRTSFANSQPFSIFSSAIERKWSVVLKTFLRNCPKMISNFPKTLKHEGVCFQKYTKNTQKRSKNPSLLGVLGPPSLIKSEPHFGPTVEPVLCQDRWGVTWDVRFSIVWIMF